MGDKMIWIHTELYMEIICMRFEIVTWWWLSWKEWRVQRVQFSESDVQDAFDVIFIFLMDHALCFNMYRTEEVSRMLPRSFVCFATQQTPSPCSSFTILILQLTKWLIILDSRYCKYNCPIMFSFCIIFACEDHAAFVLCSIRNRVSVAERASKR